MAETHQEVVKVWIAPGCIVCDSCENDCPEVFDVQEETCVIRPPAQGADFLKSLTPSIIVAAEGCPVDVIKFETKEVPGEAPWANQPEGAPVGAGAPAKAAGPAKAPVPMAPADPKWQALLSNSKVSPSLSAGLATTIRRSPEVNQTEEIVRSMDAKEAGVDWKHIPPDQRAALLSVAGAYQPATPLAERVRHHLTSGARSTRRQFNLALVVAWGAMAAVTATFGAMFQDFFGPKVLKEPKSVYRVGKTPEFSLPGVYEQYKPNGIWIVNLTPDDTKLVALSTTCTHLGCIPNWLEGENKFKCPCHGSGYHRDGVNFEGPTPRPLERYAVSKDPDGYLIVDKRKVFRQELGEWDNPESFIDIAQKGQRMGLLDTPLNYVRNSQIWNSIFRHGVPRDRRTRVMAVMSNVFLHLHPVAVRKSGIRLSFTWCMGGLTFFLFLAEVVSGVLLMFYYRPVIEYAYQDIQDLRAHVTLGLLREIHRWGAHAMIIAIWLHMMRVFLTGSYKPPREFNWVVGTILLVLTMLLSFTGYLLPWDQLAIWAITVGSNMAKATPLVGAGGPFAKVMMFPGTDVPMIHAGSDARFFLLAGTFVGENALLRFYVLHCVFIPCIVTVLIAIHFWRIRKDGGISGPL